MLTKKWHGKLTLSVRNKWSNVMLGLGLHPNPIGLQDSSDLTIIKWLIDKGGPDLNKVGIIKWDQVMKKKALSYLKRYPYLFVYNFFYNFRDGITMTSSYFRYDKNLEFLPGFKYFYEIPMTLSLNIINKKSILLSVFFLIANIISIIIFMLFPKIFNINYFFLLLQGLTITGILCTFMPPMSVHNSAYYPYYILFLSISLYSIIRLLFHIIKNKTLVLFKFTTIKLFSFKNIFYTLIIGFLFIYSILM